MASDTVQPEPSGSECPGRNLGLGGQNPGGQNAGGQNPGGQKPGGQNSGGRHLLSKQNQRRLRMSEADNEVFNISIEGVEDGDNPEPKSWNIAQQITEDEADKSTGKCYIFSRKLLKLSFILVTFSIVLLSLVTSKLAIIFITSNIVNTEGVTMYSSLNNQSCVNDEYLDYPARCGMPVCNGTKQGKIASYPGVRWMWGLFLCITTPYVITIIRSVRQMLFKKKDKPKLIPTIAVLTVESLHTCGLMILVYQCLPALDATRAVFLMSAVGFLPSILRPIISFSTKKNIAIIITDVLSFVIQLSAVVFYPIFTAVKPVLPDSSHAIKCQNSNSWPDILFKNGVISEETRVQEVDFWPFSIGLVLVSVVYWENFIHDSSKEAENKSNSTGEVNQGFDTLENLGGDGAVYKGSKNNLGTAVGGSTLEMSDDSAPKSAQTAELQRANNLDTEAQNSKQQKSKSLNQYLWRLKKDIHETRTKTNMIVYTWKLVLTFCLLFLMFSWKYSWKVSVSELFSSKNFDATNCRSDSWYDQYDWLLVYAIQAISTLIGYYTATITVMGSVQVASYTLAVTLATPVSIVIIHHACIACGSAWPLDTAAYFNCSNGWANLATLASERWTYIGIFWWLCQLWLTRHLWFPTIVRMARTDKIMIKAGYCGALFEQSLAYNRRRDDGECEDIEHKQSAVAKRAELRRAENNEQGQTLVGQKYAEPTDDPSIPKIYLCATMWHEERKEMVQLLKSILRLDYTKRNQSIWNMKKEYEDDLDNYTFEAHVFFDDAFDKDSGEVNSYVKRLIDTVKQTAPILTEGKNKLDEPIIFDTPYGGRVKFILPYTNQLIIHLKDKMKIRNKKRWSQVMYMYYFLTHILWGKDEDDKVKDIRAKNTFLLALDGDVDFRPDAVERLIDLMKRNDKVGAACGRIHPIGSGPMVWYQKFEYSIGHWLQKATEHVLGCVLCSPGCFSLFRGSALLDDNVMNTYSNLPDGARQHMQYDQGEDRWLCTLLLKQGYKVEYSAAADAFTYAPEGFEEFFKQRRRWTPSTMSNILELLESGGKTVKANENISWLYMVYQGILFFTSILGPGTIFMLMIGALESTFFETAPWAAFLIISLPILLFVVAALTTEGAVQLKIAFVLSTASIILQIVVLVGLIIMIQEDGLCNPASWILVWVVGVFVLAAVIHPNEGLNVLLLPVYFLCVPAMYLILIIYAVCNLNDVGWGTRETKSDSVNQDAKGSTEDGVIKKTSKLTRACCPCFALDGIQQQINVMNTTLNRIYDKEKGTCKAPEAGTGDEVNSGQAGTLDTIDGKLLPETTYGSAPPSAWQEDDFFDGAKKLEENLDNKPAETQFWEEFIQEYGLPIEQKDKKKTAEDLKELRNSAALAFFMFNAIFIVLISTLEVAEIQVSYNCTRPATQEEIRVDVGAIAIAFTVIFGFVMALQVGGMLIHRIFTLLQVISSTKIFDKKSVSEKELANDMLDKVDKEINEDDQAEPDAAVPKGIVSRLSRSQTMNEHRKATMKKDRAAKYVAVLNMAEKDKKYKRELKTLLPEDCKKEQERVKKLFNIEEEDWKKYEKSTRTFLDKEIQEYPAPDYD